MSQGSAALFKAHSTNYVSCAVCNFCCAPLLLLLLLQTRLSLPVTSKQQLLQLNQQLLTAKLGLFMDSRSWSLDFVNTCSKCKFRYFLRLPQIVLFKTQTWCQTTNWRSCKLRMCLSLQWQHVHVETLMPTLFPHATKFAWASSWAFPACPRNHAAWQRLSHCLVRFLHVNSCLEYTGVSAPTHDASAPSGTNRCSAGVSEIMSCWLASSRRGKWLHWLFSSSLKPSCCTRLRPLPGTKLQVVWARGSVHHDMRYLWRLVLDFSLLSYFVLPVE